MKKVNLFAARWWNPLVWLYVVLGPVVWPILSAVAGIFIGAVLGYEEGLRRACDKMEKIVNKIS